MDDLCFVQEIFLDAETSACSSNHVDWANSTLNFTQKQSKYALSEMH